MIDVMNSLIDCTERLCGKEKCSGHEGRIIIIIFMLFYIKIDIALICLILLNIIMHEKTLIKAN